jgi:hypothetical protein
MIKLTSILKEMAETDIHFQNVLNHFLNGDNLQRMKISKLVSGVNHTDEDRLKNDLLHLDYDDIREIEMELGILDEESKGLWHNIRAKRARGEKPAKKGSKAFKKAVAAAKEINKATK